MLAKLRYQTDSAKILLAGLFCAAIVLMSCGSDDRPALTFFNNTDSSLCYYEFKPVEGVCPEIEPNGKSSFRGECSQGREQPMVVVITTASSQEEVYKRSASCREWKDSGGTFIIEQRGDKLVVTDSLPDESP